ncbi:hypothetical protein AALB19_15140 [Oscillospiraceae bacterium 50-58]
MMTEDKSQLVSLGLQLAEMGKEVQKAQDLLKEVVEEYGMSSVVSRIMRKKVCRLWQNKISQQ